MLTGNHLTLAGTRIDVLTEHGLTEHVAESLAGGRGGWIVTANVDILRRASRDPVARAYVDAADIVVADGMPLIWAARLSGEPLPERVTGASLFWSLGRAAARANQSVFILGGPPGAAEVAARRMTVSIPGLVIAGTACPPRGFEHNGAGMQSLCAQVAAARPGLVLVGLGFPKQEMVIAHLRTMLDSAWYLGCGASVTFAAGAIRRAPLWMQNRGLEWLHRLSKEPRRLARRYLLDDAPFTLSLLAQAARPGARRQVRLTADRDGMISEGQKAVTPSS